MKKTIRFISLFLAIVICLSLCGCVSLDELRATSGILTEDGVIKLYDGTEYKRLDNLGKLSPYCDGYNSVYIVNEEIPLLLVSVNYVESFTKSYDEKFILAFDERGNEIWYCRSDIYDSVVDEVKNGFIANRYCYPYYDYENQESHRYLLTDAQANTVANILSIVEPEMRKSENIPIMDSYIDLYLTTDNMIFMEDIYDIGVIEGIYYIIVNVDDNNAKLYRVPDDFNDEFASIVKKQVEADEYWDKY